MHAIKTESNMVRHLALAIFALMLIGFLGVEPIWWALIILVIGFVISAELLNSALELLIDVVHPEFNKQIGLVKDMLAAMVLVLALSATVIGLIMLFQHMWS